MKKIIQGLEKQVVLLNEHVSKRRNYKNFRSDSYAVNIEAEHDKKTDDIEIYIAELKQLIIEFKELV